MTIRLNDLGQVYLVCGKTDMRQGIDSPAYLVKTQFDLDPFSGQVYLLCGGRKDRFKALFISASGGIDGVRDIGLVESAVANVFETYFGVDQYPTIEEKAARLCYSLIKNHGFLDGNKRIGVFAMLVLLEINSIVLECTDKELVMLGLGVASSDVDYEEILNFIKKH